MGRSVFLTLLMASMPGYPVTLCGQALEVDHVFVFVEHGADGAQVLRGEGFVVDPNPAEHAGQGTASLGVMFRNAYLELIWIDDASEFDQLGFGFPERRATPDGSPFGIGLRRALADEALPFATEPYVEEWMAGAGPIQFAAWTGALAEPAIFVVPESMRWDTVVEQIPQVAPLTEHRLPVRELTGLTIIGPGLPTPSAAVRVLDEWDLVEFGDGASHALYLTFDGGAQGETIDLRPLLPIIVHY